MHASVWCLVLFEKAEECTRHPLNEVAPSRLHNVLSMTRPTQVELVQQMIDGVDKLIKLEESI